MVRANRLQLVIAWLAGARFDIAYYQAKEQLGQLFGSGDLNGSGDLSSSSAVLEAKPSLDHGEL